MKITPLIPDEYDGPIKRLTCTLCRHAFYLTRVDYDRQQPVSYCHECSWTISAEAARGRALLSVERKQETMRVFEHSLELDPPDLESVDCLGWHCYEKHPEQAQEKAAACADLKKAVTGSFHRILLANESYSETYISYGEWHRRLEEEIVLIQAYRAACPHTQDRARRRKSSMLQNRDQPVPTEEQSSEATP